VEQQGEISVVHFADNSSSSSSIFGAAQATASADLLLGRDPQPTTPVTASRSRSSTVHGAACAMRAMFILGDDVRFELCPDSLSDYWRSSYCYGQGTPSLQRPSVPDPAFVSDAVAEPWLPCVHASLDRTGRLSVGIRDERALSPEGQSTCARGREEFFWRRAPLLLYFHGSIEDDPFMISTPLPWAVPRTILCL
jgi:hypothetical protein